MSENATGTVPNLTAEDVAARERMPMWSVYEMAKNGEIPSFKIGRRVRFRLVDIEAWERDRVEAMRAETEARKAKEGAA